jgi:hypothetical protein
MIGGWLLLRQGGRVEVRVGLEVVVGMEEVMEGEMRRVLGNGDDGAEMEGVYWCPGRDAEFA